MVDSCFYFCELDGGSRAISYNTFRRSFSTLIKIPESRFLFGPVGPANLSFSVRSVHRGDTLVRSVRSVAYISEFGRSGPTVVEIRSGGPTGPVPPLQPSVYYYPGFVTAD